MRTLYRFALLLAGILLAGCATVGPQISTPTTEPTTTVLQQIVTADLAAAIESAKADNDIVALQCWNVLQANLGSINKPLPQVKGIASGIQAKRSVKARVDAGLPPQVVSGCATLYVQEHFGVMKDLMMFIGLMK